MINKTEQNPSPNPLALRICECNCGNSFQPRRKDQVYLNKQHADYAYNNGDRLEKKKNQDIIEKILRKNNRVCGKYFEADDDKETICLLESVNADGFNLSYTLGQTKIRDEKYFHTYNYRFHLFMDDGIKKIKIRKL
jgi:hypothetical protein